VNSGELVSDVSNVQDTALVSASQNKEKQKTHEQNRIHILYKGFMQDDVEKQRKLTLF